MLRFTWSTQVSVMLSQVLHPGNLFYIVVNLTTGREIVSAGNLAEEANSQTYLFYLYEYLSVSLFNTGIDQNLASVKPMGILEPTQIKILLLQGLKFAYENFTRIFHYLVLILEIKQSWILLVSMKEVLSSYLFFTPKPNYNVLVSSQNVSVKCRHHPPHKQNKIWVRSSKLHDQLENFDTKGFFSLHLWAFFAAFFIFFKAFIVQFFQLFRLSRKVTNKFILKRSLWLSCNTMIQKNEASRKIPVYWESWRVWGTVSKHDYSHFIAM